LPILTNIYTPSHKFLFYGNDFVVAPKSLPREQKGFEAQLVYLSRSRVVVLNSYCDCHKYIKTVFTLSYLTLPYGEGVLHPSAEASSGPNARPWINL